VSGAALPQASRAGGSEAPGTFAIPGSMRVCLLALCLPLLLSPRLALAEPARRVVSMNPSLTAILVAIGARSSLVGVDEFSAREQPGVARLPTVGGLYNPGLEAVVALAPDLVVLVPSAEQRDFRARLAALEIPCLELNPIRFDEVLEAIELLGARVGRQAAAARRVREIRRVRSGVEAATRELPRVRALLVLQRDPPFVVGSGSFVDEMMRAAGAENVGAEFDQPYPRVTREWIIDAAPEVLLDSSDAPDDAGRYWSQWPSLPAVRQGRVVTLSRGVATLPGPYLDRALLAIAAAIHGPEVVAHLAEPAP
jgi:ABC-type Fe3+-hydroxamate transport system substrate-binding protein